MLYRRGSRKEWSLHILEAQTDVVQIESVGVKMPLQAIYEGV